MCNCNHCTAKAPRLYNVITIAAVLICLSSSSRCYRCVGVVFCLAAMVMAAVDVRVLVVVLEELCLKECNGSKEVFTESL